MPNDTPAVIDLRDVHKHYTLDGGRQSTVLEEVRFSIASGEFVAVMGPSGSGKSTLMNIMGLLDIPSSGQYLLDGVDVSTLNDASLCRLRGAKIGFVFQQYNLLPRFTVLHNVLLPALYGGICDDATRARARALLTRVGLEGFEERLPPTLSGGQQQRVAIARALIGNPSLILADEPTGNLDTASSIYIMELLADIHAEGRTIVLVTHEPDIARYADRLIHVRDGRIEKDERMEKKWYRE